MDKKDVCIRWVIDNKEMKEGSELAGKGVRVIEEPLITHKQETVMHGEWQSDKFFISILYKKEASPAKGKIKEDKKEAYWMPVPKKSDRKLNCFLHFFSFFKRYFFLYVMILMDTNWVDYSFFPLMIQNPY